MVESVLSGGKGRVISVSNEPNFPSGNLNFTLCVLKPTFSQLETSVWFCVTELCDVTAINRDRGNSMLLKSFLLKKKEKRTIFNI